MSKLRISGIMSESIVDGPGMRFAIFTQGCPHHCPSCHNPQTHDFNGGYDIDTDELYERIIADDILQGVTFSGGEPMCQPKPLLELAKKIKSNTDLSIVIYSGYTLEQLKAKNDSDINELLDICDWLIDGRFEIDKKDLTLPFRGSSNQRIIFLKNNTIEWTR